MVLIEGDARILDEADLPTATRDAFVAKFGWNPPAPVWVFVRITPHTVRAWRESNEIAGRDLMLAGKWLA